MSRPKLGFIGAGNIASALIRGLLETGTYAADQVHAADLDPQRLSALAQIFRLHPSADALTLVKTCPVLLLAVKPQQVPDVMRELAGALDPERHVLISVAAGIPTGYLERALGQAIKVVRVMPNTPVKVRAGATAFCLGRYAGDAEAQLTRTLFAAVGTVVQVGEELMDAVTALSGSGPAYVFRLCEVLVAAGIDLGLTAADADRLAKQTIFGAARMLLESKEDAADLRRAVTSPGGTTEAALQRLEAGGLAALFQEALRAARDRARELTPRS